MMILVIIIIALIAFIIYFYFRPRRPKMSANIPYLESLIAELENNEEIAIRKLKEALNIDTNLVDGYIRLGNLYRKRGDIERAIKIHQSLTVRPTLRRDEEKKIYFSLVQDYLASNRPNKAVAFLREILKIDRNDENARNLLLQILEDLQNYQDCITLSEEHKDRLDNQRLAYYYSAQANVLLSEGGEEQEEKIKEGLNLLKKALKIKPDSVSALFFSAEFYKNKGDLKKAKDYYLKLLELKPDFAFLVIENFEKVAYETGSFEQIIPLYEKIFKLNPKNFSVGFALASLYEKKNEVEYAREIYRRINEMYPEAVLPRIYLLKLSIDTKEARKELAEIEKILSPNKFVCNKCGNKIKKFSFLCTSCRSIESYLPQL
ncbi:MAG: tetratricopeptide repeat protein [candidate division WOR-3 bacterium]|nr:tetratricopeptide repeat protein [candidate division WOR-3 bacterium]